MSTQKLQEVGEMLDVTEKDIRDIRKSALTKKIWYWIIGAAVAIIAALVWFFSRKESSPDPFAGGGLPPGYPYAAAVILPHMLRGKKAQSKIAILLVSALAFLVALKANSVFGQAIEYNVYKR